MPAISPPSVETPKSVYFFGTCLVDLFVPEAGEDAIRLLEREGYSVVFPDKQSCCGQPAYTSGLPEAARKVVAPQLDIFPEPWPIVVPSGSCAGMMRHHWPRLFAPGSREHAQAEAIAARVQELAQFLLDIGFDRPDLGSPTKVTLHTSCSARREMDTHLAGRKLLAGLSGVELATHDHESECCGFGGTFALRHPDISGRMVADKVGALAATGAAQVVSADCGCLLNILGHGNTPEAARVTGTTPLQGEHLASFLWRRTREGGAA